MLLLFIEYLYQAGTLPGVFTFYVHLMQHFYKVGKIIPILQMGRLKQGVVNCLNHSVSITS